MASVFELVSSPLATWISMPQGERMLLTELVMSIRSWRDFDGFTWSSA